MHKAINIFLLFFLCCTVNAQEANSIERVEKLCLSAVASYDGLSSSQRADGIECMTYLRGLWDGFQQASEFGQKLFCPVNNMTAQEMARLFLAGSVALPKDVKVIRGTAPLLFTQILNKRYQCK